MIKFFRKIRQKLLNENKFSKYLIYAIGEIILVVIGILIALAVNTQNEQRKEIKQEQIILKQLNDDYKANLVQLENKIEMRNKITCVLCPVTVRAIPCSAKWSAKAGICADYKNSLMDG